MFVVLLFEASFIFWSDGTHILALSCRCFFFAISHFVISAQFILALILQVL
jgi:hypothetical protein